MQDGLEAGRDGSWWQTARLGGVSWLMRRRRSVPSPNDERHMRPVGALLGLTSPRRS